MTSRKKILAISGSTRENSSNQVILKFIAENYGEELQIEIYQDLVNLPFFNPDLDKEEVPVTVKAFRERIQQSDGIIICTPEYVYSLPGILKNAIEWTVSTTLFSNKPMALITASASGEKAHESLLLVMKTLYARVDENTCLLINGVKGKVTNSGEIADEKTAKDIKRMVDHFSQILNNPLIEKQSHD